MFLNIHYQLYFWCTKQCELENETSNKMKFLISQLLFRILLPQRFTATEWWNWGNDACIQKQSRNPMPMFSNFPHTWVFRQFLLYSWQVCSQQRTIKVGRSSKNAFHSPSITKGKNLDEMSSDEAMFSSKYEQSVSKQRFSPNFSLQSEHYSSVKIKGVKALLNTLSTEASCCFVFISRFLDETQMYDTNNVHLIWVNTRKSCLNSLKISAHCLKLRIKLTMLITGSTNELPQFSDSNVFRPVSQFTSNLPHQISSK